jgi:hypothetical protein
MAINLLASVFERAVRRRFGLLAERGGNGLVRIAICNTIVETPD